MLAARYYAPRDIRVEEVPVPVPKDRQVLIRVKAAGICGSDLHNYRIGMYMTYAPVTVGHEFCGTVCETGPDVTALRPGDWVVADSRVYCGECPHCTTGKINRCQSLGFLGEVCDGGFAEYVLLEEHQAFKLPACITTEQAALLEPLSVALHIWSKVKPYATKRVAIIGAGPIGQLVTLSAAALSDAQILVVEPSEARRAAAKKLGAHITITPDEARDYADWATCVIEAVGKTAALVSAFKLAGIGSSVILAGLFEDAFCGDMNLLTEKELSLLGVNGFRTEDMLDAISLIKRNILDPTPVISQSFPLRQTPAAFALMNQADGCPGKILVLP